MAVGSLSLRKCSPKKPFAFEDQDEEESLEAEAIEEDAEEEDEEMSLVRLDSSLFRERS